VARRSFGLDVIEHARRTGHRDFIVQPTHRYRPGRPWSLTIVGPRPGLGEPPRLGRVDGSGRMSVDDVERYPFSIWFADRAYSAKAIAADAELAAHARDFNGELKPPMDSRDGAVPVWWALYE
jgi:hypothetical protein